MHGSRYRNNPQYWVTRYINFENRPRFYSEIKIFIQTIFIWNWLYKNSICTKIINQIIVICLYGYQSNVCNVPLIHLTSKSIIDE